MSSRNRRPILSRRSALCMMTAGLLLPRHATAAPRRIRWGELIPTGVSYGEIVAPGIYDTVNDIWIPEFDPNGSALNTDLDGQAIILAGHVIPLELTPDGVTEFVLVPFVGACIHVPPPPPNQLVFVTSEIAWPGRTLWNPVLVTGTLHANMKLTDIAQVGYTMTAGNVEDFRR